MQDLAALNPNCFSDLETSKKIAYMYDYFSTVYIHSSTWPTTSGHSAQATQRQAVWETSHTSIIWVNSRVQTQLRKITITHHKDSMTNPKIAHYNTEFLNVQQRVSQTALK